MGVSSLIPVLWWVTLLPYSSSLSSASTTATATTTRHISFPLKSNQHTDFRFDQLRRAFQQVVDSSDFFEQTTEAQRLESKCNVPKLGDTIQLEFQESSADRNYDLWKEGLPAEFILSVESPGVMEFGWVCVKLYEESKDCFFGELVDTNALREAVVTHHNSLPPHPGHAAGSAKLAGSHKIDDLFVVDKNKGLKQLKQEGFLILDNVAPKATRVGNEQLTHYLVEKTNQASSVRTDTVHFLNREEAELCGFQEHFDTLMGLADFLNRHMDFHESPHSPMMPATHSHPLTIPSSVQLAEYKQNDFYKAHSDNSLTENVVSDRRNNDRVRSNFRHYTCILYCNEDWDDQHDGGALRLYPNTRTLKEADEAIHCNYDFIDVAPKNGRLLIFDSCLIHSVQRVLHKTKKRRALTLWINRPDHSGVRGETYF